MEKLSQKIPDICRAEWDEMTNFNFMAAWNPEMKADVKVLKGHRLQPTFPSDVIEYAYDEWTPSKGDVFIASFPRTGTNWTTEIVRQILFGRDEELSEMSKSIPVQLMLLEGGGPKKFKVFDNLPFPRHYTATHLPATLINVEKFKKAGAKIICVIRNPKDQAYSWFKFSKKLPYMQLEPVKQLINCEWPQFLDNYISGKIPIGMKDGEWYLDHINSWYPHRDGKNVMFLCFEDMKRDLPKEVRRLAAYLDVDLSEEDVANIAEKCGFTSMKKSTDEAQSDLEKLRKNIQVLHKGQVGSWKDYFTVAQSEAIDAQVETKLSDTDIKFTYEL